MQTRQLGKTDLFITPLGFGSWAVGGGGWQFGWGAQDDRESIAAIDRALDHGINWIDTAAVYGLGHSEEIVAKAIKGRSKRPYVFTKCSMVWDEKGHISHSLKPESIRREVEESLRRLQVDVIDLYQIHWPDPDTDIEEGWTTLSDLKREGKVRYLGLSEASAKSIRRAHKVHPITALQSEYSLLTRDVEGEILDTVRELGITFVPYSPLARGLATATVTDNNELPQDDFRRTLPRFDDDHWQNNKQLVDDFAAFAQSKKCTPAQLALAWVLAQGDDVIPIPGTKKRKYLEENAAAVDISLIEDDLQKIKDIIASHPNIGQRYSEGSLKLVNH